MADFQILSPEEMRDRTLRALNAEFPELRTGEKTAARLEATAYSRVVADNHVRIGVIDADATPLNASERGLQRWSEVLNVPRKAATGARKSAALEIRGTVGSVVTAGTELTHSSGLTFRVSASVTLPADEVINADVEAVDTGPSTRLNAGAALRFTSPPAGIEQTARLVLNLDEGGDPEEPIGLWRQRVLTRFQRGAQGGNQTDYEQWVLEAEAAIASAYIYGNKPTGGSVSIAALRGGTGTARVASSGERSAIADYVDARRPITDQVTVMTTPTRKVHADVQLETLPSAAFPWDDSAGYTVGAYDAVTRVLTISPGVPPTLSAGHRLVIASADPETSGADGFPSVVSAILDGTQVVLAPYLDRSAPLSWTPDVGDAIYAQSDTSDAVRDAILDGYEVGCNGEAESIPGINQLGPANPGGVHGDWQSDVTLPRLQAAALSVAGVVRPTIVEPLADVEAEEFAFPDDDQVELLIPGQIIVRSA